MPRPCFDLLQININLLSAQPVILSRAIACLNQLNNQMWKFFARPASLI